MPFFFLMNLVNIFCWIFCFKGCEWKCLLLRLHDSDRHCFCVCSLSPTTSFALLSSSLSQHLSRSLSTNGVLCIQSPMKRASKTCGKTFASSRSLLVGRSFNSLKQELVVGAVQWLIGTMWSERSPKAGDLTDYIPTFAIWRAKGTKAVKPLVRAESQSFLIRWADDQKSAR